MGQPDVIHPWTLAGLRARSRAWLACWLVLGGWGVGDVHSGRADEGMQTGAWVVTQVPAAGSAVGLTQAKDDRGYPPGSRVVWVPSTGAAAQVRVLSQGLEAAGEPAVEPGGESVLFAGRAEGQSAWQIHRASLGQPGDRPPVAVTALPGGAVSPAWLPGHRMVFVSAPIGPAGVVALYSQSVTGGVPRRLTFGIRPVGEPTVLTDGRILFGTEVPGARGSGASSFFVINNDGTEVDSFACQHDAPTRLRRPREMEDGRLVFIAGEPGNASLAGWVDAVRMANPFRSRKHVVPPAEVGSGPEAAAFRAVEPLPAGEVLVARKGKREGGEASATFGIRRWVRRSDGSWTEKALFDDPAWHEVEAVPVHGGRAFMGRLSTIDETRHDGTLLCLDAGLSDRPAIRALGGRAREGRMRFTAHRVNDAGVTEEPLGEAKVETDGSFLARVPADVALSLEWVGADGRVIERCPPAFWVRPGENRACIGCHEPHGRAAENRRPLAVRRAPEPVLGRAPETAETGATR